MKKYIYEYLVSYSHPNGFGNAKLDFFKPIKNNIQLKGAKEILERADKQNLGGVVILNFQLLRRKQRGKK